jgi:splicing factor 3A subunit 1
VAKNGSNFEDLVLQKELQNPKFCFLRRGDSYRAYYEHKVAEYARGLVDPQIADEVDEETQQMQ